jgi:hypothetical protein
MEVEEILSFAKDLNYLTLVDPDLKSGLLK